MDGQDSQGSRFIHIHRTQPKEVAKLEFSVSEFLLAPCAFVALSSVWR